MHRCSTVQKAIIRIVIRIIIRLPASIQGSKVFYETLVTDFYKQSHNWLQNRWGLLFITDEAGNRPGADSKHWSRSETWTRQNLSRGGKNIFTASKTVRNEAIAKLRNNKSPGADGYAGEYYKIFENELTPILCKVYNYALNSGDIPKSWSEAIITVLHKEGKDPINCTSYRPISLLCVDYKILTSILATRIQNYIKKLVKREQTGFIRGRP